VLEINETKEGIVFNVRVIPRSSKSAIVGIQGDALKLRITAPPVEGKANEECIRFLSGLFGVARKQIVITGGASSKNKRIAIMGIAKSDIESVISSL